MPAMVAGALDVPCPAGLVALGGGLEAAHATGAPFLLDTHPHAGGWELGVANPSSTPQTVNVYAICAKAQPGGPVAARASAGVAHLHAF